MNLSGLPVGAGKTEPGPGVSLESLLREMMSRDRLALLPDHAYTCLQYSSYDRRSTTPADRVNWFANADFNNFIRIEQNGGAAECVLAEERAPGAVVRMWFAGSPQVLDTPLRIYLDGRRTPEIRATVRDLIDHHTLCGEPFANVVPPPLDVEPKLKGRTFWLPIPYAKGVKITCEGVPTDLYYYQVVVRRYAPGTPVTSFSMKKLASMLAAVEETGRQLMEPVDGFSRSGEPSRVSAIPMDGAISPGGVSEWHVEGPAAIRQINLQLVAPNLNQALHSTLLEIDFDGAAAVRCPVGYFMGTGAGVHPGGDRYREVRADGLMTAAWTMPFESTAVMRLRNLGRQAVSVTHASFSSGPWAWDARSLHFHAAWRSFGVLDCQKLGQVSMDLCVGQRLLFTGTYYGNIDLTFADIRGQGRLVGDSIAILNGGTDWWGEGDEKITVDGEPFPSTFGTGTEDYYGFAWCRPQPFRMPFGGQPVGHGNKQGGYTVLSRVRLVDDIPFRTALKFDMELQHSQPAPIYYTAATFFYARPGATTDVPDPVIAAREPAPEKPEDVR